MKLKTATLAAIEIGLALLAVCGVFYLWPLTPGGEGVAAWLVPATTSVFCFVLSFYYHDLYDLRVVRRFGALGARLPGALGTALFLLAGCYWVFPQVGLDAENSFALVSLGIFLAVVLPLRGVLYGVMRIRTFAERVLILGTSPLAWAIAKEIEGAPHLGYVIVGLVEDGGRLPKGATAPLLPGPLDRLGAIIEEVRPDRIIIALTERRGRLPYKDLLNARMSGIVVEDGVKVYERFTGKLAIESLNPSYLFFSEDFKKSRLQKALRRAMSFMVALVGLIATAPFMLMIALAIKLDSRGPTFFVQERAGLKGHTFRMMKFRTMHPATGREEEKGSVWSHDVGSRVTRVGKRLRRFALDELPQFYNILRGDMNLVGPRPEIAGNVRAMAEEIPYYSLRTEVRPGLTGWAQVRHGPAVTREDVTEKMRYDLYYVKHMSFWFDLRIILDTVKVILSDHEPKQ